MSRNSQRTFPTPGQQERGKKKRINENCMKDVDETAESGYLAPVHTFKASKVIIGFR
jgi:hypothetical protein